MNRLVLGLEEKQCDLLVNIQILIEKVNATQNSVLFIMFVDYTKAFDMVSHSKLFKVLLEMEIPKHLVALVQALYAQQTAKVRWDRKSSEAFTIGKGTRQGCNISPVEFNLYAENIMRKTLENNEHGIKVGGRQINNLRYADDTTLLTTTESP